ncbi:MAG: MOSC domain-containing protein [Candidatus Eremiobacteraeota bacterium]|nr:MOSC domain-containing protein [Candidatus Eremiobacteraeota bacterium]
MISAMEVGSPLGRITRLWRYPVKSLRPEALQRATVVNDGLAGDRQRALIVSNRQHARYGKPYRGKEHHLLHTTDNVGEARRWGSARGVVLETRDGGPFFDAAPVSILIDTWLVQAEHITGMPLDPQRFRPNLFVRADASFVATEGELIGATLEAGSVRLRVRAPIERCVTITYDVETGTPMPQVLSELARKRATTLGVYCDVLRAGTLGLGDSLNRLPDVAELRPRHDSA